jgi:hypothetical protein
MINWSVIPLPLISRWFNYIASQSEINELAAIAHFIKLTDEEKIAHGITFLQVQIDSDTATLAAADATHNAKKAALQQQIAGATAAIAALQAMLPPDP